MSELQGETPNYKELQAQLAALQETVRQQNLKSQIIPGPADAHHNPIIEDEPNDDDQFSDTNFQQMLNGIVPNTNESSTEEEDHEILNLLVDIEKPTEFGPSIMVHVADAFSNTCMRPISKETSDKLKQTIRIPENCKVLQTPKMNPEIWQNLTAKARVNDLKFQSIQHSLSSGVAVLALMSNEIANHASEIPKELVAKLLKLGLDGANLLGTQVQEITRKRRAEVKPYLSPEYSGICSAQIPVSELLFGANLAETMKSTKAASAVVRSSIVNKNRFRPYSTQRPQPLNYYRPSQHSNRGRWNGQNNNRRFPPRNSSFIPNRQQFGTNSSFNNYNLNSRKQP